MLDAQTPWWWHWWKATKMTPKSTSTTRIGTSQANVIPSAATATATATYILFFILLLLLLQIAPSVCKVGNKCDLTILGDDCSTETEMCKQVNISSNEGICVCKSDYVEDEKTGQCEKSKPPPEPSGSHVGLGLGLGLLVLLLVAGAAVFTLHRKFGLLTGLCQCLPTPRSLFGIRSGDISLVDNQDDDVNPIV